LQAMGRGLGVEVSVHTSLNVGGPIVQTPQQALTALKRSQGMSGLVMIGASGSISLVWHHLKDQGRQLLDWCGQWEHLKSSQ